MISNNDLPLGFSMALMENPQVFTAFAHMSDDEQQAVINGTHAILSKQGMKSYVNRIAEQK